jgi:zinc protease
MKAMRPANWDSLPGPEDITQVELPNGITVLSRPNFNSPSIVISGYLGSGSLFDPQEKLGLAEFTSTMLMRGTQKRTFQKIFDAIESVGANLGFGTSVHNTSFGGRSLVEDLPLLLELLSEALRQPVFPEQHVERLRAQMLSHLAVRSQDTADLASLAFDDIVFNGHPYSRPEDGYPETIEKITREDMVNFHQKYYGPKGMVMVVVGAISPEKAIELISSAFGDWQNPAQPEPDAMPPVRPLEATVRKQIDVPGKVQTDLVMGMLGPERCAPEYLAASLGNSVLGQFGMMGRIGDVVREQAGLAYHASTSLNAWISAGSWEVSAGVNPANLLRSVDLIISELNRFVAEPVSKEELEDSQANYIGRLPLSLESNSGVANALTNLVRFDLGLDYYRRYPQLVAAITPELVLEAARKYIHPDRLAIVSAGPAIPPS